MLPQIADFVTESAELRRLLEPLPDADWDRPTLFKSWTINDIVQHLHATDLMGMAAATDRETYARFRDAVQARRSAGLTRVQETRERLGDPRGRKLLDLWWGQLEALAAKLAARDPNDRLPWGGPDMGVRMFATARQMEVWAHGQAIYDLLGQQRAPTDRLKNIAVIGARTFGWSFVNRGLPVPEVVPHVRLRGPGGDIWTYNQPSETDLVEGEALEFCQVVAQTRNVGDTHLRVVGEPAKAWMAIAQCFAGPPENPPVPGSRYSTASPPAAA